MSKKSTMILIIIMFIIFFPLYILLSLKLPINSDAASFLLQSQSIYEGNLILKGWTLSTGSYITTDLLLYSFGIFLFGATTKVLYVMPSLIYFAAVICAILISAGKDKNNKYIKMLVTFSFIGLPSYFLSFNVFAQPIHIGALLYMLLSLIILESNIKDRRKYIAYMFLVSLAVFGDSLSLYFAFAPILFVYAIKWFQNKSNKEYKYVLICTIIAIVISKIILFVISHIGFKLPGMANPSFVEFSNIGKNISLTINGILSLFDANFFGKPLSSLSTMFVIIHLLGFILVIFTLIHIIKNWRSYDNTTQILLFSIISIILEYLFSNMPIDINTTRYLTSVIFSGAILLGRVGIPLLFTKIKIKQNLVVLICIIYLVTFITPISIHSVDTPEKKLTSFLNKLNLKNGYGPYWASNVVTLYSKGDVRVRPVITSPEGQIVPFHWLSYDEWYKEAGNFVVYDNSNWGNVNLDTSQKSFGNPSQTYKFENYTILVWDRSFILR